MEINQLRAFLCVAKHMNFTKAADELFISQPALSKKIADFERAINAQLFIRDSRNVELTPAGIALYNEAPSLLAAFNDLAKKVKGISENPNDRLNIVCSGVEYDVFPSLIHDFRTAYPNIDITLRWCSALEARNLLINNMIDVGFQLSMETAGEPNIDFFPFFMDRLDVIVGPYHRLAGVSKLEYKDLQSERYIAIKPAEKHLPYEHILSYFRRKEVRFDGGFSIVDSLDTLILQVSAGLGVSALSHKAQARYGSLIKFIPASDAMQIETDLVWNRNNLNPSRRIFTDFAKQWCDNMNGNPTEDFLL